MRITMGLVVVLALGGSADAAKRGFEIRISGSLLAEYTDNQFRLSDEDQEDFPTDRAPGEQFFAMKETSDLVSRLRVKSDLTWRMANKRKLGVLLQATYYAHLENAVSDYPRFDAEIDYRFGKVHRLYGGIDRRVDRFWKNYVITGTSTFGPAVYDQSVFHTGYTRRVGKRGRGGIEVRHLQRDYDAPFSDRDREGDYVTLHARYPIAGRLDGQTSVQAGEIEVAVDGTGLTPIDRSFDERLLEQLFLVNLRKKQELELLLQYREREYTTPFPTDLGRFGRTDERMRIKLGYSKRLTKKLTLRGHATYTDNASQRLDPAVETDEVGYEEAVAGIGLGYTF